MTSGEVDERSALPRVIAMSARLSGWPLMALVGVLAFAARIAVVLTGGGFHSVGAYDDGVYYAAADAFVHGRVPYRDFLLLHPPGIVVALAPFAWLGSVTSDATGLAVARLAFVLIGAVNAMLVVGVLRRYGSVAALVGGVFYALFYPAVYAERTTLLEPLGTLGTLIALLILSRVHLRGWWVFAAGVALGLSLGAKIWYIVPVIVIIAFQRRERLRLIAGTAAGGALIYLPFFVLAPSTMFRYVVTDQLTRSQMRSSTLRDRAYSILGVAHAHAIDRLPLVNAKELALLLLVALAVVIVIACRDRSTWVYVALFAANAIVLLESPSFFAHYATLTAAPLAILVGIAVAKVVEAESAPAWRVLTVVAAIACVAAFSVPNIFLESGERVPAGTLQGAVQREPGCITADDPTILAVTNVLSRDLAHGCPLWPDVTGWTYGRYRVVVHGKQLSREKNPAWQAAVLSYLRSGSATIVFRQGTGLDARSVAALDSKPVLGRAGRFVLRSTR